MGKKKNINVYNFFNGLLCKTLTPEFVDVSLGVVMAAAEDDADGVAGLVEPLGEELLLGELMLDLCLRDEASGDLRLPPPQVLEEQRRALADVQIASSQEPPEHQIIHLLKMAPRFKQESRWTLRDEIIKSINRWEA